jgi:hypothetical protein
MHMPEFSPDDIKVLESKFNDKKNLQTYFENFVANQSLLYTSDFRRINVKELQTDFDIY